MPITWQKLDETHWVANHDLEDRWAQVTEFYPGNFRAEAGFPTGAPEVRSHFKSLAEAQQVCEEFLRQGE